MEALHLRQGTLGRRAARRLRGSPWFEDLLILRSCDSRGRVVGVGVPTVEEALDWLLANALE